MHRISFSEILSFCSLFSWAVIQIFSLELFHITTFVAFEKCKKGCNSLKLFCDWLLNFLMDSALIPFNLEG